jgi:serine/threonine-protein kinase
MERLQQIEEIFQEALQHDPGQRDTYVRRACRGDTELQREVLSLLANHDDAGDAESWAAAAAAQLIGAPASLQPGHSLGPYRVECFLAAGGMGEVYRATDTRLHRKVAVKVSAAQFSERFEREARLIGSLNHPNICQLYDIGPNYLVMELVEGPTLANRIRRGALPLDEALTIARQIAEALEAAHEKGRVHRDLKPANIKFTPEGVVKLLDFGLAKAAEEPTAAGDPSDSPTQTISPTRAGVILGTAAYMSPEQARGEAVDKRADIWAFGCVLYEMLTGKAVFHGDTTSDILAAVLRSEPNWSALPVGTPPRIRKLLQRCLERYRNQRLRDIGEARIAIDAHEEEAPHKSRTAGVFPWAAVLATAVCLAVAGWWRATRPAPPRQLIRLTAQLTPGAFIDRFRGAWLALSPDGTRIVVAESEPAGGWRLVTRSLDESQFAPLFGADGGVKPFFSPNGQWIAFFADNKLKKIPVRGGVPVTLCDAPEFYRGASWGDDGNIVAAFSGGSTGLVRISSSGGAATAVTQVRKENGETAHGWPQVLPGAQVVLFTAHGAGADDESEIAVVSLKTGERKTVYKGGFFGRYLPSGYLVFLRGNTLFASPFDLRRLALTATPQPVLEEVNSNVSGGGDFNFSLNGTLVYANSKVEVSFPFSIWWLDSMGQTKPLHVTPGLYENPRLSPDGKRLAFELPTSPAQADIWVKDLERDTLSRVTHLPGRNNFPLWTPDGNSIVFISDSQATPGIYWIRADGVGEPQRLTDKDYQAPTSFSPDGKRLAYSQVELGARFHSKIWTAPVEGNHEHPRLGKAEPFLHTSFSEEYPAFSPDGHWLAYSSDESGTDQLYVRPFPGPGSKWQVSTGGGSHPIWARKEHKLFFVTPDWKIMVLDYGVSGNSFVPGKPHVWSPKSLAWLGGNYPYDLAPDGKHFAVVINPAAEQGQRPTDSVTVLLNFFDELRRRTTVGGK